MAWLVSAPALGVVRLALLFGMLLVIGAEVVGRQLLPALPSDQAECAPAWWRLRRLARLAVTLLGLVVAARLVQQAAAFAQTPSQWYAEVPLILQKMTWGHGWLLQAASVAVLAATAVAARGVPGAIRLVGIAGLALSPALSGHAVGAPRLAVVAVGSDAAHVAAAGIWLGSLAAGVATLGPSRRKLASSELLMVLARFSPLALSSALVLSATGAFASWLHLETLPALWQTRYGQTLLLKVAATAAVAAVGAVNWRIATPRLAATGDILPLSRAVMAELTLACILLAITAALIVTPLPAEG